jgi:hypothetical protein
MRRTLLAIAIFAIVSSCSHRIYLGDRGTCRSYVQGVLDGKPLTLTANAPKDVDPKKVTVAFIAITNRKRLECREDVACAGVLFHRNGDSVSVQPSNPSGAQMKVRVSVSYPATGNVCTIAIPGEQSVVLWNKVKVVDVQPTGAHRRATDAEQEWSAGCSNCTLSINYRPIFTLSDYGDFSKAYWEWAQRDQRP